MAGVDVGAREPRGAKKGVRRLKRRTGIRIDMTPMVDIAFLLLIFYMVSTVFSMPQAMEINLPPKEQKEEEVEVKESNLLTIRVDKEGRFWWNLKTPTPDNLPLLLPSDRNKPDTVLYKMSSDTLRGLLVSQNKLNPKLNTLVLIHRDASYADMVNVLDEIDLIERSWNSFKAKELGLKFEDFMKNDQYKPERFSYRYAIGDWEPRDDKVITEAERQAMDRGEI
ncbi:MAG TPA: biopolymer transporter ExbD [Candidatus Deferrimicrobium sp.]|nr:biopolymer transporter ExbD [Candidatus Deferrimicrobium sp.]